MIADYALRVSGRLPPALMSALHPLQARDARTDTLLVGPAIDRAGLHGYIERIEALGLELVELRRLPPGDETGGHRCPSCGEPSPAIDEVRTRTSKRRENRGGPARPDGRIAAALGASGPPL